MNRKAATWLTATVLATIAGPVLAKSGAEAPATHRVAGVSGPADGYAVSEPYVRLVARQVYVWAWPMISMYNRVSNLKQVPTPGLNGGVVPVAPINRLAMLHDYIEPQERYVTCPNQDVVYGAAMLDLDVSPVVIQVPDFGSRFWVYQLADMRTDGFAGLGKMYGTKPGFYLVAGPNWHGTAPKGIRQVLRATTSMAAVLPRVFMDDTAEDRAAVQSAINQIAVYPLAEYDGGMKKTDWSALPTFPSSDPGGADEIRWVLPEKFLDELPLVLDRVPPMPGEEALYAQARSLLAATRRDASLKAAALDEAAKAEAEIVTPTFRFSTFGAKLPGNWTTITNGAAFGSDYFTRTAAAKSNIFVNKANETRYFYLDVDASGQQLNGKNAYAVTFPKGQIPPVKGFWSLTLYNSHHFFSPNNQKRYSLGTKNKTLKYNDDGSLTLYVQSTPPAEDRQSNWLPAPADENFSLYIRAYWPEKSVSDGTWTPPPVQLLSR